MPLGIRSYKTTAGPISTPMVQAMKIAAYTM